MVQFLINPETLKKEINSLKKAKDAISTKLELDTVALELQTIDKLKEVETEFNKVIDIYKKLLEQDIQNLEVIIAEWMKVDAKYAGQNAWTRFKQDFWK